MHINFLENHQIDKSKWDFNLSLCPDKDIYGCAWYLDIICPNWKAIVLNDYDIFFPVFEKKKFFLKYLLQPVFVQQISIYSKNEVASKIINDIFDLLQRKYLFIYLHIRNNIVNKVNTENVYLKERANYVIDLNNDYSKVYRNYNENTKRNIKKAEKNSIVIKINSENPEALLKFWKKYLQEKVALKNYYYNRIYLLLKKGIEKSSVMNYVAYNEEGKIIAFSSFFYEFNKVYYLFACSNDEGKEKRAMFKIIDSFLKNNSGKNLLLSFEGSVIENIARFFKGFGAVNEVYFSYFWTKFSLLKNIIKQ
ncbi:MAG: hypothetical protein N3A01_09535 [Bacteroidales bacterium]|nr:hypothetical protein [Bacteroidales bacterium]